jgi:putative oxidoreductase
MPNRSVLTTIARLLMAVFFIASGTAKVFAFQGALKIMIAAGFPAPHLSLVGINSLEIGGGLALLFGLWTRYVSVALILFLVLATVMFHARFITDPVSGADQFVHMIKNVAIIGGLFSLIANSEADRG